MSLALSNTIKVRLTGTRPLLMSRGEVANTFDPQGRKIKEIATKSKKTDCTMKRVSGAHRTSIETIRSIVEYLGAHPQCGTKREGDEP